MTVWHLLMTASYASAPTGFRPGQVQVRAGVGIEFSGIGGGSILSIAEGWHPASAALDLGVVDLGHVTVGIGVETGIATQFLVNPMMRARVALGGITPDWLGFAPGEEGNWRWRPSTWMGGLRLHTHLDTIEGAPYLIVVGERHHYRARLTHRTDERTALHRANIWGVSAGAGTSSVLPSGLLANIEVRYGFPLWSSESHTIDVQGTEVPVIRRMRPPPGVIFVGSLGFHL